MNVILCGIDLGTTDTKAVLVQPDGAVVDRISLDRHGQSKGHYDSADIFYDEFSRIFQYFTSRNTIGNRKIVCSVTSQGGSFVLLNNRFEPTGPLYSWLEHTDDHIVRELTDAFDSRWFYQITGWKPAGWLPACKLRKKIKNNEMHRDVSYIATLPDYIYSQMTHKVIMDITNAQMTGICDFEQANWRPEILNWTGVDGGLMPSIETKPGVLFDDVSSPWGRISFVTGSHDQYAAMEAAGLTEGMNVMLGTGTAWVLNYKTGSPVFDDHSLMSHPGRDLHDNTYGNIIGMGPIGRRFDLFLQQLGVDIKQMDHIESQFPEDGIPHRPIMPDIINGVIDIDWTAEQAIRRYMEYAGSLVAYMLERYIPVKNIEQIIMSGGAVRNRFWPQVISDMCDTPVFAIDFQELTAYGAALLARSALMEQNDHTRLPKETQSRFYEPSSANRYHAWYVTHQKPMLQRVYETGE